LTITHLIDNNIDTLQAAITLLETLPADRYTHVERPYFESSLGKHLRHIVDHYLCFQRDLEAGIIDYDQRLRDSQLESDRDYAINVIRTLQSYLKTLKTTVSTIAEPDRTLNVLMCNDVDMPRGQMTHSSLGRELQFLQGHTVHHFALMAAMVRISGLHVDNDFGVAPSTLVHEKTVKVSA